MGSNWKGLLDATLQVDCVRCFVLVDFLHSFQQHGQNVPAVDENPHVRVGEKVCNRGFLEVNWVVKSPPKQNLGTVLTYKTVQRSLIKRLPLHRDKDSFLRNVFGFLEILNLEKLPKILKTMSQTFHVQRQIYERTFVGLTRKVQCQKNKSGFFLSLGFYEILILCLLKILGKIRWGSK